jgi:hypothetical protein
MHPAKLGAGLDPVFAAPPGLGGRLTLPRQPAQPLHAGCPPSPCRHRQWLHDGSHRVRNQQRWGSLRLPPCGHAVQDGIATGIEGLDQPRIGVGSQHHRGGIALVDDEGPERAMPLHRGED